MPINDFRESGAVFRLVYCAALALIALSQLGQIFQSLRLLARIPENPNVLNPIIAIMGLVLTASFMVVALYRLWMVASRRSRLWHVPDRGVMSFLRRASAAAVCVCLLAVIAALVGLVWTRIAAVGLIVSTFVGFLPIALGTFELTRVIGLEHMAIEDDET